MLEAAAAVVVVFLRQRVAGLGLLAAVGVGVEQDVDLVLVEQPGGVGVDAVGREQLLGEASGRLGGASTRGRGSPPDQASVRLGAGDRTLLVSLSDHRS